MRIDRKEYLDRLQAWRDRQVIKVITGVRRSGKSVLLEMYAEWLREQGVPDERIVASIWRTWTSNHSASRRRCIHTSRSGLPGGR